MMSISHKQSRAWIDEQADGLLSESNKNLLQTHLGTCAECSAYAAEIHSLEKGLGESLTERWGQPRLSGKAVNSLVKNVQEAFPQGGTQMADKDASNGNQLQSLFKQPRVLGAALLVVLLGVAFFYYNGYRNIAGQPPLAAQAAQVSISQPGDGLETEVLTALSINAIAAGPSPFLSMELWINGELSGVQAAPSAGKHPFSTNFAWLPKEAGVFSLVARAIDENSQTTTSAAVVVFVSSTEESGGELSAALADVPAVLPAAPGGYSPPSPPAGGGSVGPADNWNGSPGDWVDSLNNDTPPNAPELIAEAQIANCGTELTIHDLSDNEQGFAVYRQLGNAPNFVKVATLASNSQTEWISYTEDLSTGGGVTYYVSSFNAEGEAESNLAVVNIDPVDCMLLPVGQNVAVLALEFAAITLLETSPDTVYCYQSINGSDWTRWPLSGFFVPDDNGAFAEDEIFQLVLADLDGNVTAQSFVLNLNCWGWFGTDLQFLGSFELANDDLNEGDFSYTGDIFSAAVNFDILKNIGPDYELGPANNQETAIGLSGDKVIKHFFPPDMVYIIAYSTVDPEDCTSHLMPDAQNLFGTLIFCFPYPGFHGGFAEGDNPQTYLVWDFSSACPAGFGFSDIGGPCKSYGEYLQMAEDNGGTVGFTIYDNSSAGNVVWSVEAPNLRNFTIPPNGCDGARSFFVEMWYQEGGFTQRGPVSNHATIACPKPVGDVVTLDFVFESMTFNNIDDGEDSPQDVEVYGYFQVMAPSSTLGNNNFLKIGTWQEQASNCPDDTGAFVSSPPPGCPQVFKNGTHNLYNVPMCRATDYTKGSKFQCVVQVASNYKVIDDFATNNNKLRVEVQDGDGINLAVAIYDWDDRSADDLVCWSVNSDFAGGFNIFQWDAMDGQGFALIGWGDDGTTCSVSGVIHVIK